MALMPTKQNGPAARSFAADAHDRIMVRINDPTAYKSVTRKMHPWRAPLGSSIDRQTGTDPKTDAMQKARLAVHRRSACSGVKALRNTSDARRPSRQALLAFRSLDPFRALREPDRRRRDEERPSRSEQRTDYKPKSLLDRKSPIQVRIRLPPAASLQTIGLSREIRVAPEHSGEGRPSFLREAEIVLPWSPHPDLSAYETDSERLE